MKRPEQYSPFCESAHHLTFILFPLPDATQKKLSLAFHFALHTILVLIGLKT